MERFKFRVWDKLTKQFLDNKFAKRHVIIDLDGVVTNLHNGTTSKDDLILQQWTGLKDKNDNDIFEGDIVIEYGYDQNRSLVEDEEYHLHTYYIIRFGDFDFRDGKIGGAFFLDPIKQTKKIYCKGLINKNALFLVKIIGNELKNPELLEK